MKYPESYLQSKDIDWFFQINNSYIHVASAGGSLPASINNREKLRNIQHQVFNLPYLYSEDEVAVNMMFIQQFLDLSINYNPEQYFQYLQSFMNFARKGFISLDRTYVNDPFSNYYHIVCAPKKNRTELHLDYIPNINPDGFPKEIFDYEVLNNNIINNNNFNDIQLLNFIK